MAARIRSQERHLGYRESHADLLDPGIEADLEIGLGEAGLGD